MYFHVVVGISKSKSECTVIKVKIKTILEKKRLRKPYSLLAYK